MDKKQGIKARAQAHREYQADLKNSEIKSQGTEETQSLDETNYIMSGAHILEEVENRYSNDRMMEARDGRARYIKSDRATKRRGLGAKLLVGIIATVLMGSAVAWALYQERYGLSTDVMDVNEYYATLGVEKDMFIILNNEVVDYTYIEQEGMHYLPYELVNNKLNPKIYWDYEDKLLLYSYPEHTETVQLNGQLNSSYEYHVAWLKGEELYISLEYIQEHTDLEWELYNAPNRLVINNNYEEYSVVELEKGAQVRYRGGVKSEILVELKAGAKLELLESGVEWHKVATQDGFTGYIPVKSSSEAEMDKRDSYIEEEIYERNLVDYKICMGWHQTTNMVSNNNIDTIVQDTDNMLTTIAPTWFFIDDTLGNIKSLASQEYVDRAHNLGMDVWATLNDFDGGIGSQAETYYALNSTAKRTWIIEQVMSEVLKYGIDGINVDIELVSKNAGNHFVQFLRELSIQCRANGIVLSVDNYPAESYNSHYEWAEQADVVDYIIVMGYDEYYNGSKQAGPVSSINYTKNGVTEMLKYIEAERLINAIPFYSRLWEEVDKTQAEIDASEDGDKQYLTKVSSASYGMEGAKEKVAQAGATITWDDVTKNNYASWTVDTKTYKIWLEDVDSTREKLAVMDEYNLAGVAAWKLGIEDSAVWDAMRQYLEK